ncbi:hypothetical protein FRC07_005337, partial [Ceratobasidium sp. 392]
MISGFAKDLIGATIPAIVQSAVPALVLAAVPDLVQSATPSLVKATTPALVEDATPALVEAATPALVKAAMPALVDAVVPVLVEASKPALVEAAIPALVETATPALAQAAAPALLEAALPRLIEATVPALTQAAVPALVQAATPTLMQAVTPVLSLDSVPTAFPASASTPTLNLDGLSAPLSFRSAMTPLTPISPVPGQTPTPGLETLAPVLETPAAALPSDYPVLDVATKPDQTFEPVPASPEDSPPQTPEQVQAPSLAVVHDATPNPQPSVITSASTPPLPTPAIEIVPDFDQAPEPAPAPTPGAQIVAVSQAEGGPGEDKGFDESKGEPLVEAKVCEQIVSVEGPSVDQQRNGDEPVDVGRDNQVEEASDPMVLENEDVKKNEVNLSCGVASGAAVEPKAEEKVRVGEETVPNLPPTIGVVPTEPFSGIVPNVTPAPVSPTPTSPVTLDPSSKSTPTVDPAVVPAVNEDLPGGTASVPSADLARAPKLDLSPAPSLVSDAVVAKAVGAIEEPVIQAAEVAVGSQVQKEDGSEGNDADAPETDEKVLSYKEGTSAAPLPGDEGIEGSPETVEKPAEEADVTPSLSDEVQEKDIGRIPEDAVSMSDPHPLSDSDPLATSGIEDAASASPLDLAEGPVEDGKNTTSAQAPTSSVDSGSDTLAPAHTASPNLPHVTFFEPVPSRPSTPTTPPENGSTLEPASNPVTPSDPVSGVDPLPVQQVENQVASSNQNECNAARPSIEYIEKHPEIGKPVVESSLENRIGSRNENVVESGEIDQPMTRKEDETSITLDPEHEDIKVDLEPAAKVEEQVVASDAVEPARINQDGKDMSPVVGDTAHNPALTLLPPSPIALAPIVSSETTPGSGLISALPAGVVSFPETIFAESTNAFEQPPTLDTSVPALAPVSSPIHEFSCDSATALTLASDPTAASGPVLTGTPVLGPAPQPTSACLLGPDFMLTSALPLNSASSLGPDSSLPPTCDPTATPAATSEPAPVQVLAELPQSSPNFTPAPTLPVAPVAELVSDAVPAPDSDSALPPTSSPASDLAPVVPLPVFSPEVVPMTIPPTPVSPPTPSVNPPGVQAPELVPRSALQLSRDLFLDAASVPLPTSPVLPSASTLEPASAPIAPILDAPGTSTLTPSSIPARTPELDLGDDTTHEFDTVQVLEHPELAPTSSQGRAPPLEFTLDSVPRSPVLPVLVQPEIPDAPPDATPSPAPIPTPDEEPQSESKSVLLSELDDVGKDIEKPDAPRFVVANPALETEEKTEQYILSNSDLASPSAPGPATVPIFELTPTSNSTPTLISSSSKLAHPAELDLSPSQNPAPAPAAIPSLGSSPIKLLDLFGHLPAFNALSTPASVSVPVATHEPDPSLTRPPAPSLVPTRTLVSAATSASAPVLSEPLVSAAAPLANTSASNSGPVHASQPASTIEPLPTAIFTAEPVPASNPSLGLNVALPGSAPVHQQAPASVSSSMPDTATAFVPEVVTSSSTPALSPPQPLAFASPALNPAPANAEAETKPGPSAVQTPSALLEPPSGSSPTRIVQPITTDQADKCLDEQALAKPDIVGAEAVTDEVVTQMEETELKNTMAMECKSKGRLEVGVRMSEDKDGGKDELAPTNAAELTPMSTPGTGPSPESALPTDTVFNPAPEPRQTPTSHTDPSLVATPEPTPDLDPATSSEAPLIQPP